MTEADLLNPVSYEALGPEETGALCREISAEIASGKFPTAGESSRDHWDRVWAEHRMYLPPYLQRPASVLRVNQRFVRPTDPWLEARWYISFRADLLKKYFREAAAIYEFGCGNGWNLQAARVICPEAKLLGLDWSPAAVARINRLAQGPSARPFDFFAPDDSLKLPAGTAVWTVGALEQTGTGWEPFLDYLLAQRPALVVNVEPVLEWYDPTNLVDRTAIQYHLARNYWVGFPPWLEDLQRQGRVEILEKQRSYFGSKYIEGYSLLVWRPV